MEAPAVKTVEEKFKTVFLIRQVQLSKPQVYYCSFALVSGALGVRFRPAWLASRLGEEPGGAARTVVRGVVLEGAAVAFKVAEATISRGFSLNIPDLVEKFNTKPDK